MIDLPIVILAGGLGTRLRPITKDIPKALIKINNVPFLEIQLEFLKKNGFKKIYLLISYKSDQIEKFLRINKNFGLEISLVYDGDKLLGTGGAIKKAIGDIKDYFFITYGDSYLPIDYKKLYDFFNKNKMSTMTVLRNNNKWDMSNTEFDGKYILNYSKNKKNNFKFIDYGLMILNKIDFDYINATNFDLTDIITNLTLTKRLQGFEVKERFYEIGSFDGIDELQNYLKNSS